MATFSSNDALLETRIAQKALTQLNLAAIYPRVAIVDYENGAFEYNDSVKVRRPKRRTAQNLDPRVAAFTFTEAAFFSGSLTLDRLWTDGYLTYGYDSRQTVEKYVTETASQIADAIITPHDAYMYSQFRTWSATTGNVKLGDSSPISIAACVDDTTGQISKFNNDGLAGASVFLDKENVPANNRYVVISSTAKGSFLGDAVAVTGFAAASIGSGQIIERGLQIGEFVERYGFMVSGSNTVGSQAAIADLDTVTGTQATLAIASAIPNTAFTYADNAATTYVGAIDITLTCTTALSTNVAVGQIVRLGTSSAVTAFGVILRLDKSTPTAPIVTLVPFAVNGAKKLYSDVTAGTDLFSIPSIPSINTVNHREGLIMATRQIKEPSQGSGAVAASITDPNTNITIQIFRGNYDTGTVSEKNAAYMLTGAKISDFRKCGLILSL